MRFSLSLVLALIAAMLTWTASAPPQAMAAAGAHAPVGFAADPGDHQHEHEHDHPLGCCHADGSLHCAGAGAGLPNEAPGADPFEAAAAAPPADDAERPNRHPAPPAKPPRA
jgi:hypothetical protein